MRDYKNYKTAGIGFSRAEKKRIALEFASLLVAGILFFIVFGLFALMMNVPEPPSAAGKGGNLSCRI